MATNAVKIYLNPQDKIDHDNRLDRRHYDRKVQRLGFIDSEQYMRIVGDAFTRGDNRLLDDIGAAFAIKPVVKRPHSGARSRKAFRRLLQSIVPELPRNELYAYWRKRSKRGA